MVFWTVLAGTCAIWLLYYLSWIPGQTFDASRFIFFDQGSFLYAVERALAGERLYSEFAWQYGPLALGWFEAFARVAGNTPVTLVFAGGVATALAWTGLVLLAARKVGRLTAWVVGVFGLLPAITAPCLLSLHVGPHGALEAALLVGIAWLIADGPPATVRTIALGLAIGLLQLVRFGPHLVAGVLALLLVLVSNWHQWPVGRRGRNAARVVGVVGCGYALIVLPFAGWLLARLPSVAAAEQLWPVYMIAHYRESAAARWPKFETISDFAEHWLPCLLAGLLIAGVGFRAARTRTVPSGTDAALLFLPLYFVLGCAVLLRSSSGVLAYSWMAWPAMALIPAVGRRWMRGLAIAGVSLACGYNVAAVVQTSRTEHAWQAKPMVLPNGRHLWFHGSESIRFEAFARILQGTPPPLSPGKRRKLVVLGAGGGFLHFFDADRVGRHWWYLPEFVRPWESVKVAQDIGQHELLLQAVFYQDPNRRTPDRDIALSLPLDSKLGQPLVGKMEFLTWVPGVGYVFQVMPQPKGQ